LAGIKLLVDNAYKNGACQSFKQIELQKWLRTKITKMMKRLIIVIVAVTAAV
jgi:hypothetical protein